MFSIHIEDANAFSNFLASCELDYLDVYLHEDSATFIMNTSDLFSVIKIPCSHTPNEHSRGFRVSRNLLKQQKRATTITFNFTDAGDISTSFMSGDELLCNATFAYQKVYSSAYANKLELLRSAKKPSGIKLSELRTLIKLCNALGGVLNIESGTAGAIFSNGIRMYKRVKYKDNLCILTKYAQLLNKCDDTIFSIEDYVGASKNDFAILVNKLRVRDNSEFTMLEQARSQYRANINLSNLVSFATSHPMKLQNFIINLDSKLCEVVEGDISYKIPITITDETRAPSNTFRELVLPFSIVRNIILEMPSANVLVEKKQFFMRMDVDNYTVLFN